MFGVITLFAVSSATFIHFLFLFFTIYLEVLGLALIVGAKGALMIQQLVVHRTATVQVFILLFFPLLPLGSLVVGCSFLQLLNKRQVPRGSSRKPSLLIRLCVIRGSRTK